MKSETKKDRGTFLDRLTSIIETKVAPPLMKLSQMRYLSTLQQTFITLMPYLILGATATLVLNFGGLFAEGSGLNMPDVANTINSIIEPCRPWLLQIVFVTINLIALLTTILNGYYLGRYYEDKDKRISPVVAAVVAMIAFLCFIDFAALSENFDWPSYIMGSPSLFGGIVISICAVEIYRFLIKKNLTIKMPEGVPPMITAAFTSMIPVCAIVILFSILGQGIAGFKFLDLLNEGFSYLVIGGSGPVPQFIGFFLDRILWFVGLHGSSIVSSVMQPIWTTMITDNINAFASGMDIPFMFTEQWINFYVRVSVLPIAILCWRSRVKRFKVLGKLSLPGTVFNIAEPIMYGLPIVLNPLMFVPWVLGFSVLFIFNAVLGVLGLTPPIVAMVVWTMPAPIAALIGSGFNPVALVISLMNFVLVYFIFLPFFRVMERQELKIEEENEKAIENSDLELNESGG